ncbi:hypothetical protein K8I61_14860 [bacterium]|nr:hypothetical protein [bacterium]
MTIHINMRLVLVAFIVAWMGIALGASIWANGRIAENSANASAVIGR